MSEKKTLSNQLDNLRRQAEEKVARMAENHETLSPEETRRTLHELRVHQIELEMQNVELRSVQAELGVARARYFDLFDLAPVGYCTIREDGIILEANLTAAFLLGVVRGVLIKQPITRYILKGDQDIYYLYRKHLFDVPSENSGQAVAPRACELRMVKKGGAQFWARLEATAAQDTDGAPLCRVVMSDITERKQAGEKIQQNESRLRTMLDILQHPFDIVQDFLDYALNQAIRLTESKIGYIYNYHENLKEFVLNTWSGAVMAECAIADPSTRYELEKTGIWGEAVRQRRPITVNDYQSADPLKKGCPEGHVQLFKFMTVPIFKDDGIVGVIGLANKETDYERSDILQVSLLMEAVWKVVDHKRAENALQESEERFRKLFKCHSAIKLVIDPETGTIIDANEAAARFYGWPLEKLKRMRIQQINMLPPEAVKAAMEKTASSESGRFEFRHRKADGSIRDVEVFSNRIEIAGKCLLYSIVHDITDRKRAETSLRESEESLRVLLSQKEVLLKEVHHRVKNNLQVISSLISLQADKLPDAQSQGGLRDVRDRVQTITLVHEMLHQSDDLAQLDFAGYAASLLQYLWRVHGPAAGKVRLNVSIASMMLPVEAAGPCGLILNELISNVLKHAFPGGGEGEVSVALEHDPATGAACLRVRDNGVGLPADLKWRQPDTLGLHLVQMLAGQIHGTVQTGPGPGTEFQVNFKV